MEQLGFDPAEYTYAIEPYFACCCGKCQVINITSNSISIVAYDTIPTVNTRRGMHGRCGWCESRSSVCSFKCPCSPCKDVIEQCCEKCHIVVARMFEFYRDPHPILKNLSPNDYLKTDQREQIIGAVCKTLRPQIYTSLYVLRTVLPNDLCRIILNIQLEIIRKKYRISASELIS